MNLASTIGWMMVGTAAALTFCLRRGGRGEGVVEPISEDLARPGRIDAKAWCCAVGAFSNATVMLFDSGLRLVASGDRKFDEFEKKSENAHLIDIAPKGAAAAFLDGAAAARRGEMRSWEVLWHGRLSMASAAPVGDGSFLVWIREMKR